PPAQAPVVGLSRHLILPPLKGDLPATSSNGGSDRTLRWETLGCGVGGVVSSCPPLKKRNSRVEVVAYGIDKERVGISVQSNALAGQERSHARHLGDLWPYVRAYVRFLRPFPMWISLRVLVILVGSFGIE